MCTVSVTVHRSIGPVFSGIVYRCALPVLCNRSFRHLARRKLIKLYSILYELLSTHRLIMAFHNPEYFLCGAHAERFISSTTMRLRCTCTVHVWTHALAPPSWGFTLYSMDKLCTYPPAGGSSPRYEEGASNLDVSPALKFSLCSVGRLWFIFRCAFRCLPSPFRSAV